MLKKMFILLSIVLLSLLACTNNAPVEDVEKVEEEINDKILIGVLESYQPYFNYEKEAPSGPHYEIIDTIFMSLDIEYELVKYPWSRLMKAVETGEVDMAIPFYDTPERRKLFYYSNEPISYSKLNMISREDVDFYFDGTFKSIEGKEVGIVQDYYYSLEFEQAASDEIIIVDEAITCEKNIEKLLENRIDLIIMDYEILRHYVKEKDINENKLRAHEAIVTNYSYIVYTKARDLSELREAVDEKLKLMKSDNSFYNIYKDHGLEDFAEDLKTYETVYPALYRYYQHANESLRVGILGDTKPYAYYEDDKLVGFGVEFISEVLDRAGVNYELIDIPFNRMLEELKSGALDIGTDLYKKPDREVFVHYPQLPYAAYPTVLFKKSDSTFEFTGDYDLLKDYTISAVRGYYLGDLEKYKSDGSIAFVETDSPEQNMEMLVNDRVDLMVDIKSTGENTIKKLDLEGQVVAVEPPIYYDYSYIVFTKMNGLENLLKEYEIIVNQMFEDGTIKKISEKYGLEYLEFDELK
jgi:ABC-type amino acid transport substrate-binding protein